MHPKHFEMLRANYVAPNHTISVQDLADAVGYKRAFTVYGRLGRILCDELGFHPTMKMANGDQILTQVLAEAPEERTEKSWEWALRPEVVHALEALGWVDSAVGRSAHIVIWNPSWWHWDEQQYAREVRQTASGKLFASQWSCGNTKKILPGDRLYLFRVESDRGLIGSGYVTSTPFYDAHWEGSAGKKALYVRFQSDALVNVGDRLPIERLLREDLGVHWNRIQKSGIEVPKSSIGRLERLWKMHLLQIGRSVDVDAFDDQRDHAQLSDSAKDSDVGIERVLRQIIQRRGQPKFREQLLDAYGGCCAITGCNAKAALEAAHIEPYSGPSSNKVSNGLLLRSDIHTLFDLGLIAISSDKLKVQVDPQLLGTHYEDIAGKNIRVPQAVRHRPDPNLLDRRWKEFKKRTQ